MLSFILCIVGTIITMVIVVNVINRINARKVNRVEKVKPVKVMTKNRYNTIAGRLLLAVFLSTFVCLFVNSYIPLIATAVVFVGFLVFARKKYGYRAIEYTGTPISMMTKEELFKKFDEEKTFITINSCSIYYSDDK